LLQQQFKDFHEQQLVPYGLNGTKTFAVYDIERDETCKFRLDINMNIEWACWVFMTRDIILSTLVKDRPDCIEFNVKTGVHKRLANMITGRRDFVFCRFAKMIWAFGGESKRDNEVYRPQDN
jgi:hypothetical protein